MKWNDKIAISYCIINSLKQIWAHVEWGSSNLHGESVLVDFSVCLLVFQTVQILSWLGMSHCWEYVEPCNISHINKILQAGNENERENWRENNKKISRVWNKLAKEGKENMKDFRTREGRNAVWESHSWNESLCTRALWCGCQQWMENTGLNDWERGRA